jgi:hypothetical protein
MTKEQAIEKAYQFTQDKGIAVRRVILAGRYVVKTWHPVYPEGTELWFVTFELDLTQPRDPGGIVLHVHDVTGEVVIYPGL